MGYAVLVLLSLILSSLSAYAYTGNSALYDVIITDLSPISYEETYYHTIGFNVFLNMSVDVNMKQMPVTTGNSDLYEILPGLSRLLGPIAFGINITPEIARINSTVNCTGINTFSLHSMPKHYYRFTDGANNISTNWSESGILNCLSVGGCIEPNLTCHFKVDDSFLNSTEITKTIIVHTLPPQINLISPNNTQWNQSLNVVHIFNATDSYNISSCSLMVDGVIKQTIYSPENNKNFNFTGHILKGMHYWNVSCTDSIGNEKTSETYAYNQTIYDDFYLTNIGATGFEQTNPNYTYTRLIIKNTDFSPYSTSCRYRNENENFTIWAPCVLSEQWMLTELNGVKTVYAEINHTGIDTGVITNLSASITLETNGTHLDTTPPEPFSVYTNIYSNKNESYSANWDTPIDSENSILNGRITFSYMLLDNTTQNITVNWNTTLSNEITLQNLNLSENHTYIIFVNATNEAGLTRQSYNTTIIDLTKPEMISITSDPLNSTWSNNINITFNFTANDSRSGIAGFSMILDNNPVTTVDDIKEEYNYTRTYTDKSEGIYYLHIKPYDAADNFGNTTTYGPIKIDRTAPTIPQLINKIEYFSSQPITFTWENSTDALSGINYFRINITNINDSDYNYENTTTNLSFTFTNLQVGQYYANISAVDNAGNGIFSSSIQVLPLQILTIIPNDNALIRDDPIIKVTTSREAICKDNKTNEEFIFTNSTYHETKLIENNGAYSLTVTCKDSYGYIASSEITYTVNKDIAQTTPTITSSNNPYAGKPLTINMTLPNNIGQVKKEEISVYINDTKTDEFTLYDIDGKGNYIINIISKKPGDYSIKVGFGNETSSESLVRINDATLNIEYNGASIISNESNLMIASYNGKKFGLASDSNTVELTSDVNKFNIDSSSDGKSYIFFTKNKINTKTKNTYLSQKTFRDGTKSFGYTENDNYKISANIEYKSLNIQGINELSPGLYNIFIQNLGQDENKKTILRIELE